MAMETSTTKHRSRRWARPALVAALFCSLLLAAGPGVLPGAEATMPPVTCDDAGSHCTVVNCYREWADRTPCQVGQVVYPRTEAELVSAVADAVRNGTKIKLVSKTAHSFTKLVCPAGDSGLLISTRELNSVTRVDKAAMTVTVDAGVQVRDLLPALAEHGLAFPYTPYWSELSVSGAIATGSHASSMWGKGSAMHEYVAAIRVVVPASARDGYAVVKTVDAAGDPERLAALKVHLGVLGAVSQVTLRVQPQFRRSITFDVTSDGGLESRLHRAAREQEFGDVLWFPAQHQVRYRADNRADADASDNDTTADTAGALENFPGIPAPQVLAFRAADLASEAARDAPGQCARAAAAVQATVTNAFGFTNNGSAFQGYPVVGFSHRVQASSGCSAGPLDTRDPANPSNLLCLWDLGPRGGFVYNAGIVLPVTKISHFVRDVRRLVRQRPYGLCDVEVYGGMLFRFVKGGSSALLGHAEDSVDIDFTFKRANDAHTPVLNNDVHSEVEQMAVFKYGGVPHWGKSRPVTFAGVAAKYPAMKRFLKVKQELDPQGLFSNEWTDAVLGVAGDVTHAKPFCALEGLCICSEDVHCAPEAGYFCRPGLVYKQARVCRFEGRKASTSS